MITFRIVVSLSSFYSPLHFSFARFGRRLNSPLSIAGSSRRNEKNGARSTRRGEARSGNNHRGGEKEEEKYWVAGRLSSSKLIKHHTLSLSPSLFCLRVKFIILLSFSIRGMEPRRRKERGRDAPPRRDIVNGMEKRYPTREFIQRFLVLPLWLINQKLTPFQC